jgi:hypothetical protein
VPNSLGVHHAVSFITNYDGYSLADGCGEALRRTASTGT